MTYFNNQKQVTNLLVRVLEVDAPEFLIPIPTTLPPLNIVGESIGDTSTRPRKTFFSFLEYTKANIIFN